MTGVARVLRVKDYLPNSRMRAWLPLMLFVVVQIADGVLTHLGIVRFGVGAEANPLLVHSMMSIGSTSTLMVAKSVAIAGGGVLHVHAYYLLLAMITVGYVFATVLPWALILG